MKSAVTMSIFLLLLSFVFCATYNAVLTPSSLFIGINDWLTIIAKPVTAPVPTIEDILNCGDTNFVKIFYNSGRSILASGQASDLSNNLR
jgi:hypothetical protein